MSEKCPKCGSDDVLYLDEWTGTIEFLDQIMAVYPWEVRREIIRQLKEKVKDEQGRN